MAWFSLGTPDPVWRSRSGFMGRQAAPGRALALGQDRAAGP